MIILQVGDKTMWTYLLLHLIRQKKEKKEIGKVCISTTHLDIKSWGKGKKKYLAKIVGACTSTIPLNSELSKKKEGSSNVGYISLIIQCTLEERLDSYSPHTFYFFM